MWLAVDDACGKSLVSLAGDLEDSILTATILVEAKVEMGLV